MESSKNRSRFWVVGDHFGGELLVELIFTCYLLLRAKQSSNFLTETILGLVNFFSQPSRAPLCWIGYSSHQCVEALPCHFPMIIHNVSTLWVQLRYCRVARKILLKSARLSVSLAANVEKFGSYFFPGDAMVSALLKSLSAS